MKTMRSLTSALAFAAAMAAVGLGGARDAHAQGMFGVGEMTAGGSVGFGDRLGGGGFGLSAHFELAMMVDETAIGNWLGFEFISELGYEKYKGKDPYKGEWTMGPLILDLQLGFPFTILHIGDGGPGTTLVSLGLGAGLSAQHMYGYLRARILTAITETAYLELMGRWTPAEASADGTDHTGLAVYQLRLSTYFALNEDLNLQVFAEWTPVDRTRVGDEDPTNIAHAPPETTTNFQNVVRIGVGVVF
ncbi:MAG: hypothetical protein CVU56_15665 [Deltaproteobacteria bacterium HGW-Deltaproteobacteria-14]|jgi:hypothetical protein|nr:MAG: hypothetical protein CVU56_15665 [Deltaproteobacteria bacterium HGW-Deltaproteobacteria-14]